MNTVPHAASNGNLPATSGIYKITCTATNKIYIGSSVNLQKRKWTHVHELRQNRHINLYLQRAWNKYGEDAFIFEVVELTLPMNTTAREQYWLEKLKPFRRKGFNIAYDADAPTLGRKLPPKSPEAIEKIRQANLGKKRSVTWKNTPETIEKRRLANLGRKQSPEAIEKSRQAHLGRKLSPEHIEKVRQANLGKKQPIEAVERTRQANLGRKHTSKSIENMKRGWLKRKEALREALQPEKQCTGLCRRMLPATLEFFGPDKRRLNGLQARCRDCKRIANRKKGVE